MLTSARLCSIPTPKWNSEFLDEVKKAALVDPAYQKELIAPGKNATVQDGILYFKNRLWIPNDLDLKKVIMSSEHNTRVAEHMGMDKTTELIRRYM